MKKKHQTKIAIADDVDFVDEGSDVTDDGNGDVSDQQWMWAFIDMLNWNCFDVDEIP